MDREQGRRRILAGRFYCLVLAALPAVGVRAEQPTPEDVRADALMIRPFRGPDVCREMDSLSAEDVIHLLDQQRQLNGALAKFFEEHPEGTRIVKAKRRDCIDPPRVVAVLGPAELHHARFACTVDISPTAGLTLGEGPRSKTATMEIEVRHLHLVSGAVAVVLAIVGVGALWRQSWAASCPKHSHWAGRLAMVLAWLSLIAGVSLLGYAAALYGTNSGAASTWNPT